MSTSSRPYHLGDVRERLLAAAERASDDRDLRSLSLRELAREVGVSPGAPYKHFETKDTLLLALAARWMEQFVDAQVAAMAAADRPGSVAEAAGNAYVGWAVEHPRRFAWIYSPDVIAAFTPELGVQAARHGELLNEVMADVAPGEAGDELAARGAQLWATVHGLAVLANLGLIPPESVTSAVRANLRPPGEAVRASDASGTLPRA